MNNQAIKNEKGFSLIEVLVAITLVSIVFAIFAGFSFSEADDLEGAVSDVERAVRFSVDEAALRNVIVRTRFYLDGSPQKMSVEYGPDDSFVIPLSQIEVPTSSVLDKEKNDKKDKEFNKKFNRVPEFSDGPREVNDTVRVVGVGSALTGLLFLDGQASIYAYPTGEKDGGIVILSNQKQMVGVTFTPFLLGFDKIRKNIDPDVSLDELPEEQDKMAKEMFESWIKK
ncbi:MAG: prepilin-type N-terminal cleavage/methylation domain-containing protein [Bacteriovoracaceae bacterium]|jgi:prepilin-type N-terminal cleavage/methylation domain-containing protein